MKIAISGRGKRAGAGDAGYKPRNHQARAAAHDSVGGVPAWGISFTARGKTPLAIFTLSQNIVFIEFTLPLDAAERIIRARKTYSATIREQIEAFRCIKCPKQCKGNNLTKIDGVWLCSGRAEARRIYTTLSTLENFASIHTMLDIIYSDN